MAAKLTVERVIQLIDDFGEEEDYPESDDDQFDSQHINCDFLDEGGEKIVLTSICPSNEDSQFPCERDSFLLHDTDLTNGMFRQ